MVAKGSQPALYEKMRNRPAVLAPPPAIVDVGPPLTPRDLTTGGWLKPGRVIRLPVGYVLVAGTLTLVLLVSAYTIGYRSGQRLERHRYEQAVGSSVAGVADQDLTTLDPLAASPSASGRGLLSSSTPANSPSTVKPTPRANWGDIESDPRKKGFYYYVLATTKPDGARRLANFCRNNGLETYVVPCDNKPSFRWVVAEFPRQGAG
jgi:hypothetical protein